MDNISIPMNDLQLQYLKLKTGIDAAVLDVMKGGQYINGKEVNRFSDELADYLSVKHVIPCANGTDAIQLALMALNLKPGDEVITTAFSFFATAEAISILGLIPVFADIDPKSFNIDPKSAELLITPRSKCILPVHLFGHTANMIELMNIAQRHKLYIVEDVAQALGADVYIDNAEKKLGTIGHIGCTSFFPTKNLGCFGDGGAVMTNDSELASKIKMLAVHGSKQPYRHETIGLNSRLDTIQAAILRVKLPYLDNFIFERQNIAEAYIKELNGIDGLIVPEMSEIANHTFNQFTIRIKNGLRDELKDYLSQKGISSKIYYPVPLDQQVAMQEFMRGRVFCSEANKISKEVLSLPIYPGLAKESIQYIVHTIHTFFKTSA